MRNDDTGLTFGGFLFFVIVGVLLVLVLRDIENSPEPQTCVRTNTGYACGEATKL